LCIILHILFLITVFYKTEQYIFYSRASNNEFLSIYCKASSMKFFRALYYILSDFLYVDSCADNFCANPQSLITLRTNLIKDDAPRLCSRKVRREIFYQTTAIRGWGPRSHLSKDLYGKSTSLQFFHSLSSLLYFCPPVVCYPRETRSRIYYGGPKYAEYIIIVT